MVTQTSQTAAAFLKTTLDNGLRVLTSPMPHTRSVTISAFVGTGSRYEPADRAGISHFIEHLVFKGTERRSTPVEISGTVEGVGGILNAATEQELTVYWCKVARPYLDECLDLLLDMLRNSLYRPDELERERLVLLEELAMVIDSPGSRVDTLIDEMLGPGHPLGRDVSGTQESVTGITRDMVLDYASQFYTPANIVISVAGNVEHDDVVTQVQGLCGDWAGRTPPRWTRFTQTQHAPRLRMEYRRTEQAHLSIGLPGLSLTHPDIYALDMLSVVLGEGMSSRLFIEVREKLGLAYDVHSDIVHFQDCGALLVSAGVDPKRVHAAVDTILYEVGRLKDGIPEDELNKAKRLTTGRLFLGMEDTRGVSTWMGSQEALLGHVLDVDQVVGFIEGVTPDDVQRVADDLVMTEKLNLAVVGPNRGESRFRKALERPLSNSHPVGAVGAGQV